VSTENQNGCDSFGLETQRDAIMKYCTANGLELIRVYEDPALSGSLQPLERPGLHALLEALKAEDIKQVIVTRLDRLARDTMLSLWLMKEIKKLGAELVSIAEPGRWEDPTHIPQFTPLHNTFCTHYLIIPEWLSGDRLDV
jgi:DNA invertase Pin-like site-specific DNA recombinase